MGLQLLLRSTPVHMKKLPASSSQANDYTKTGKTDWSDNIEEHNGYQETSPMQDIQPGSNAKRKALYTWIGAKFLVTYKTKGFTVCFTNVHGLRKPKTTLGDLVARLQYFHVSLCRISEQNLSAYRLLTNYQTSLLYLSLAHSNK